MNDHILSSLNYGVTEELSGEDKGSGGAMYSTPGLLTPGRIQLQDITSGTPMKKLDATLYWEQVLQRKGPRSIIDTSGPCVLPMKRTEDEMLGSEFYWNQRPLEQELHCYFLFSDTVRKGGEDKKIRHFDLDLFFPPWIPWWWRSQGKQYRTRLNTVILFPAMLSWWCSSTSSSGLKASRLGLISSCIPKGDQVACAERCCHLLLIPSYNFTFMQNHIAKAKGLLSNLGSSPKLNILTDKILRTSLVAQQ